MSLGKRVLASRSLRSFSVASGTLIRNGTIASLAAGACALVVTVPQTAIRAAVPRARMWNMAGILAQCVNGVLGGNGIHTEQPSNGGYSTQRPLGPQRASHSDGW